MSERVEVYFKQLRNQSSEELDQSARELVSTEKQNVARLIAHLAEIGERKYHVELGYGKLFEYCTRRLKLGEGTVYRRLQVARECRRFPQILDALFSGRLNLTGASLIAPYLTEDNVEDLISKAEGKTRREIEKVLATVAPKEEFAPSIRKQPACEQKTNGERSEEVTQSTATPEAKLSAPAGGRRTPDILEPATEERYNVRFNAGKPFTEKFTRLAEVLGVVSPHNHIEEILTVALDIALDKKDPQRKLERRRKREEKKKTPCAGEGACAGRATRPAEAGLAKRATRPADGKLVGRVPCPGEESRAQEPGRPCPGEGAKEAGSKLKTENAVGSGLANPAVSRHVPEALRQREFERAGYQCEYHGPDGTRCSSRTDLEIEHTKPFGVFGSHDEKDLRVLCSAHNRHAADKYYGQDFMERKIEAARRGRRERTEVESGPLR